MTSAEVIEVFKNCPLLADFSAQSLEHLSSYFDLLEGNAGDRLFAEGDEGSGLYIVLAGTCAAKVRDVDGRERIVRNIGPGGSFGELSLILRSERLLSVDALDNVRLAELNLAAFRKLKLSNPDLCLMLIMAIVRRFGRVLDESRETLKRILLRGAAGLDA